MGVFPDVSGRGTTVRDATSEMQKRPSLKPGSCGVGGRTNEAQDTDRVFVSAFPAARHHQLMARVFCE